MFACRFPVPRGRTSNNQAVLMHTLPTSSRITPFLWFDKNAEEAVEFYCSIFPNSRKLSEFRSTERYAQRPKGNGAHRLLRA